MIMLRDRLCVDYFNNPNKTIEYNWYLNSIINISSSLPRIHDRRECESTRQERRLLLLIMLKHSIMIVFTR